MKSPGSDWRSKVKYFTHSPKSFRRIAFCADFFCNFDCQYLLHVVTIGPILLRDKPLFLAPMEDVTDPSFRYVCKHYGADVMYTEFIASDGLIRDARKSIKKLESI